MHIKKFKQLYKNYKFLLNISQHKFKKREGESKGQAMDGVCLIIFHSE